MKHVSENFPWEKVTIKYNHWFAPMIPFIKSKNKIYAKVIGKTIYFSEPKSVVLKKNQQGGYRFEKLFRHEIEHLYQMEKEGTIVYLIKYGFKWLFNFFSNSFLQPNKAYLNISYEIEAREVERDGLNDIEKGLFDKEL